MNRTDDTVLERLRAADPVPGVEQVTDADVTAVVTAARSTKSSGRTAPQRPMSRRLLLGGLATAAAGVAVGPSLLRGESANPAYAESLRMLAHDVATAPPPDADVLYAKWRTMSIGLPAFDVSKQNQLDLIVRTRDIITIEEWHPLWPSKYRPLSILRETAEYLTPGDAERAATLSPDERREYELPPERGTMTDRFVPLETRSNLWPRITEPSSRLVQDLPTDPAELRQVIEDAPEFDFFADLHGPVDLVDRALHWEQTKDQQLGYTVFNLLKFVPTPQAVRAALIELLTEVRSVEVHGERTVRGRSGLAITYRGGDPEDAMVIDRETGLIIYEQLTLRGKIDRRYGDLPRGTVTYKNYLLELDYVSDVEERP